MEYSFFIILVFKMVYLSFSLTNFFDDGFFFI